MRLGPSVLALLAAYALAVVVGFSRLRHAPAICKQNAWQVTHIATRALPQHHRIRVGDVVSRRTGAVDPEAPVTNRYLMHAISENCGVGMSDVADRPDWRAVRGAGSLLMQSLAGQRLLAETLEPTDSVRLVWPVVDGRPARPPIENVEVVALVDRDDGPAVVLALPAGITLTEQDATGAYVTRGTPGGEQ